VKVWKEHYPEFQPPNSRFYPSMAGVAPGRSQFICASVGGMPVYTGVRVIAAEHKERNRYIWLCARNSITEEELDSYLADLRAQTENLRLLLESVEADLARKHEEIELASSTEAWLMTLNERIHEVEGDSEEAFEKRRQVVKLLGAGITAGRGEDGRPDVRITSRFGPPEPSDRGNAFVDGVEYASRQFDGRLCLVAPQGPITRLLEVTGLNELFELYAGLDAAVELCALAPA
jgi:hypothetical protein